MVREILVETLGSGGSQPSAGAGDMVVVIGDDAQLNAFVARLLELFEQPEQREAIRSGHVRFRLAAASGAGFRPDANAILVERGALTEKIVSKAANEGRRLVLGPGVVATPLALDKARSLGIEMERMA
jgi:hypothetical protein